MVQTIYMNGIYMNGNMYISAALSKTFWQITFTRAKHRQHKRFVSVWLWAFKLECLVRWRQARCCAFRGSRLWQTAGCSSFLGAQQLPSSPVWRGGLTCCGYSGGCRKPLNVSCCSKKKMQFRVIVRKLSMDVTLWHVTPHRIFKRYSTFLTSGSLLKNHSAYLL